jgi:protein-disulfide isomerase
MNKNYLVALVGFLMVAAFVAALSLKHSDRVEVANHQPAPAASALVREHSPRIGDPDARVTIVEFFDPACETCRVFHPFVKDLVRAHPGKVRLVTRYAPLHAGSDEVVRILEAARLQGKYWETLEAGYASQHRWAINHRAHPDLFWQSVSTVGLNPERISADMRSAAVLRNITQDIEDGKSLGVDKTPGFFVNGKPLQRFGREELKALVEDELRRAY